MEQVKVCAILNRSAGNESIGDMWVECAEFTTDTPIGEVLKWAGIFTETTIDDGFQDTPTSIVTKNTQRNVRLALLDAPLKQCVNAYEAR